MHRDEVAARGSSAAAKSHTFILLRIACPIQNNRVSDFHSHTATDTSCSEQVMTDNSPVVCTADDALVIETNAPDELLMSF